MEPTANGLVPKKMAYILSVRIIYQKYIISPHIIRSHAFVWSTGLSQNADVKILTSNGRIVNEGKSNGGTYTWNGCDANGKKVASGIYMVATATNDVEKGTVCKIAIIK